MHSPGMAARCRRRRRELAAQFSTLIEGLDALRLSSLPSRERFFKRAQAR